MKRIPPPGHQEQHHPRSSGQDEEYPSRVFRVSVPTVQETPAPSVLMSDNTTTSGGSSGQLGFRRRRGNSRDSDDIVSEGLLSNNTSSPPINEIAVDGIIVEPQATVVVKESPFHGPTATATATATQQHHYEEAEAIAHAEPASGGVPSSFPSPSINYEENGSRINTTKPESWQRIQERQGFLHEEFLHCVEAVEVRSQGPVSIQTAPTSATMSAATMSVSIPEAASRGGTTIAATTVTGSTKSNTKAGTVPLKLDMDWSVLQNEILYERHHEINRLHQILDRRRSTSLVPATTTNIENNINRPELILLSGGAGVGKTALAKKVFMYDKPLSLTNANMVRGKFDCLQRPEPYAAFVQAMADYIGNVGATTSSASIAGSEDSSHMMKDFVLSDLRRDIIGGFGTTHAMDDISTLSGMVPGLQNMLDQDNQSVHSNNASAMNSTSLPQDTSQHYLKALFRRFFQSISSVERPLVLLLDDLQWADPSSLELLELLVSDTQKEEGFIIVGTCLPLDIVKKSNAPFRVMLDSLEQDPGTIVNTIEVGNLSHEATNHLVSAVLQQSPHICSKLTNMVYDATNGNPFHVSHLLQELRKSKVLLPDQESQSWLWDENLAMQLQTTTLDVVALIRRGILDLPNQSQILLQTCACMGMEIDMALLSRVLANMIIPEIILPVLRSGFLYQDSIRRPGKYMFPHNLVHQAAYSFIPEAQRNLFHWRIGKQLSFNLAPSTFEDNIYLVVNQMSRGAVYLKTRKERDNLAELCLKAGKKATASSDHNKAGAIFMLGTTLLHESACWSANYKLALDLYSSLANAELLVGGFDMADFAVREVLKNARSIGDKGRVYITQVKALESQMKLKEAMDLATQILKLQGVSFANKLGGWSSLGHSLSKTKKLLKNKTAGDLLNLLDMEDPDKHATMGMLHLLASYSLSGNPDMFPFVAVQMIKMTLEYGLCPASAHGFVLYGLCLCSLGEVEAGFQYGKLALAILDKFEGKASGEFRPRVVATFFGWMAHWREPLRSTIAPTLSAHRDSFETGDVECTMIGAHVHCLNAFFAGVGLGEVEASIRGFFRSMKRSPRTRRSPWAHALALQLQAVRNLMGKSKYPQYLKLDKDLEQYSVGSSSGAVFPDTALQEKVWGLVLAYHMGDHELALRMAKEGREGGNVVKSSYITSVLLFYDGMTALALAQKVKNRSAHLTTARKALKALKPLGEQFPRNLNHKVRILEAEFAAVNGSVDRALQLFEMAIIMADEEGFLQDQALACERAAAACRKDPAQARPFYESSKKLYAKWGADAKVVQMNS